MARKTNLSSGGTSFFGVTIQTSVEKLKKLFPGSYIAENDGKDKSNYDFTLETENGDVFTIYDWKEYRPIGDDEILEFHIGSKSQSVAMQAREELIEMLKTV